MIELNLLPDVKKEFIKAQRTRNTVISIAIIVSIAAGALTALLISIVYVGQPLLISSQTRSITENEQQLSNIAEIDKYLTVQNQLNQLDELHSGLYDFSRAFTYLQQLNPAAPNNVALSSVKFDSEANSVIIEGNANNFQALNVYQNTLDNAVLNYAVDGATSSTALFTSVTLNEAALTVVEGRTLTGFKLTLEYPEEAFITSIKNPTVTIPNIVTSDADRNAPKEVFGTQPSGTGE